MKQFFTLTIVMAAFALASCNEKPEDTIAVSGVEFRQMNNVIEVGQQLTLDWTVSPANATDQDVIFVSSHPEFATVSPIGIVTGVGVGRSTITVTTRSGGFSDAFSVEIVEEVIEVTGVTLNVEGTKTIGKNETFEIAATVAPENASNKTVTWEYDETIVSVGPDPLDDEKTIVKGLKGGTTTITVKTVGLDATGNPRTDKCDVIVNVPLTGIALTPTIATIRPGNTMPIVVSFTPEDATNKEFTFGFSADGVATAAQDGEIESLINVTAVTSGGVTMTVTADAKGPNDAAITATCDIFVPKLITSISFEQANVTMRVNETNTFAPTVEPADATSSDFTWTSSDPGVVSVNGGTGFVTALAEGDATITARTKDGTDLEAGYNVHVDPAAAQHPLGDISFRSTQTWTAGGLVWSDYVTTSVCRANTSAESFQDKNMAYDRSAWQCRRGMETGAGVYSYDVFNYHAYRGYGEYLCPAPWRGPTQADFRAVAMEFYPETSGADGSADHEDLTDKYGTLLGCAVGGHYRGGDGENFTRKLTSGYVWIGEDETATNNYAFVYRYEGTAFAASASKQANRYGLGVRCVKPAN